MILPFWSCLQIHIHVYLLTVLKRMAENNSANGPLLRRINQQVILVQVLVSLFLCVNTMLIVTFFHEGLFLHQHALRLICYNFTV